MTANVNDIIEEIVERKLAEKLALFNLQPTGARYLSEKQACELYATNRWDLAKARARGELNFRQDGRRVKYAVEDLDKYFAVRKQLQTAPPKTEDINRRGKGKVLIVRRKHK